MNCNGMGWDRKTCPMDKPDYFHYALQKIVYFFELFCYWAHQKIQYQDFSLAQLEIILPLDFKDNYCWACQ